MGPWALTRSRKGWFRVSASIRARLVPSSAMSASMLPFADFSRMSGCSDDSLARWTTHWPLMLPVVCSSLVVSYGWARQLAYKGESTDFLVSGAML